MFGTGLPEFIIILLAVLLLFGPAALTFWLGYMMGRNQSADTASKPRAETSDSPDSGSEESNDE